MTGMRLVTGEDYNVVPIEALWDTEIILKFGGDTHTFVATNHNSSYSIAFKYVMKMMCDKGLTQSILCDAYGEVSVSQDVTVTINQSMEDL